MSRDKVDSKPPVWTAYRHLISYHLGSMALCSLLRTLLKVDSKPPVWTAYRHLISYHLGSMALCSLLITLLKVPRLILSYLAAKLKKYEQSDIAQCIAKCCICCLYCFENCIRYINHNAYTVVAMQGINFCPAASRVTSSLSCWGDVKFVFRSNSILEMAMVSLCNGSSISTDRIDVFVMYPIT
ncbi:hypothetical protein J6590_050018 [Homalodisca vitripennis]|nr:hypothetical protein J6590_050018 [Homalodisca vitripennis]